MDAVKTRAAHHHIEVFTHSCSRFDAMGIAPTRLAICSFRMVVGISVAG
jgi:hypothetical protein